ncbi:MAG: histidyl-tRNA synthetase [Abditibacteriota bacterium]|nr:histidyl-tRNA synthetase [Abditibacteriota bacterium]
MADTPTPKTITKTIQSPRGTHDILPEQTPAWRHVENTFREICTRYNFGEIRTPAFEATELFARTAGDSSDIVVTKQMYSFIAPDEQSYTLRPEGTAGTVRAFIQNHLNERGPVSKLFYIGPNFRYEAPQAGRYRQHHQCGVELLGPDAPESDAEVLALAFDLFRALGLEASVKLNSLGTPQSRLGYIDALRAYLEPLRDSLSEDSRKRLQINPLRVWDSKDARDQEIVAGAPRLLDYLQQNDTDSMAHFDALRGYLDDLHIPYEIDAALVRGLDYYSRTAFEFVTPNLNSSIGGGGRYNGLVEELGGPPTPAIGFGIGIERVLLALGENVPSPPPLTAFLVMLGDTARQSSPKILSLFRRVGVHCDCDFVGRSLKAQMREANRQKARFALILGDNELAENKIAVKNMESGEQELLHMDDALIKLAAINADETVARYFAGEAH